ncbi:MAG: neutral/alkaline non-lysosomal ceramidase N-terminal domain-containing protein [Planctomycetota bacterium]
MRFAWPTLGVACLPVCLAAASLAGVGTSQGAEPSISAGVAVVDITPPIGYRMQGYFSERPSTGTHDPLLAKAIVLRQGDEQAALVVCDLAALDAAVTGPARARAQEKTGIPASHILIAATHTHTGPLYFGALREHFHKKAVANGGSDSFEKVDYPALLVDKLVQVIADAQAAARPARLDSGTAEQQGLSFNRRFHMKDGSVRCNPGTRNPDIVRPAGPIDPQVGVVLVRDAADNRPLASLTVFALHLDTVGGTLHSADYPYYLQQALRQSLGDRLVSVFANGTCGDINHFDVTGRQTLKTQYIGQTLAATVKAALPGLKHVTQPRLAVRSEVVQLPLRTYTPDEVALAQKAMEQMGTGEKPFMDMVKAYEIMGFKARKPGKLPALVQAIRLSDDTALVGLPGEVFVELGLAIKKASPFANTMVVELSQDCPDYVPTRKAFTEGSYETVCSWIEPGGGEMLVDSAVRLLEQLKP